MKEETRILVVEAAFVRKVRKRYKLSKRRKSNNQRCRSYDRHRGKGGVRGEFQQGRNRGSGVSKGRRFERKASGKKPEGETPAKLGISGSN